MRAVVHALAASSASPLSDTDDVVCSASALPANAIDHQANVLDTPTTSPTVEQTPSPPAVLIEAEDTDSQPPSPIPHLQLPPVELLTDDCSLPSPLTSNNAHLPSPNSFTSTFLTSPDSAVEKGTPSSTDLSTSSPTDVTSSPLALSVLPPHPTTPTTPPSTSVKDIPSHPTTTSTTAPSKAKETVPATSIPMRQRSNSLTLPLITNRDTVRQLQEQLISATLTISHMQQEIQALKDLLAQTTQQTQQNFQSFNDAEVRMKNTLKTITQDLSQQIQELRDEHTTLQCQAKDTNNKLQSLNDSQSNSISEIKKQIQTFSATKHTRHTGNQTDNAHTNSVSESSTEQHKYAVQISNKYAALSDAAKHSNTSEAATLARKKENQAQSTISSKPTHAHSIQHSHNTQSVSESCPNKHTYNSKDNPMKSRPSPLTLLRQKTVPRNCDTLLLGDSVLLGLDDRKIASDGNRFTKLSVPGLTVHHLCQWLTSCPSSPHIQQVIVHVGINSCEEGPVSTAEWVKLIRTLKHVFPRAAIKASSILPPLGRHSLTEPASQSTANLRCSCLQEGVVYVDNTPSFLAKSGAPRKVMYRDRIHPSAQGYKSLTRNLCCPSNRQNSPPDHKPPPDMTLPRQQSQSTPVFNHERDFPGTSLRNPHTQTVFSVLGRHHPLPQETPTLPPPPPRSLLHQPLSEQFISPPSLPQPTPLHPSPHLLEQPRGENHFIFPVNRPSPPSPVVPQHVATQRRMDSPIHPLAVQMLNSLASQFLHQQQTDPRLLY